jgi:anti-anti-sigma factor
MSCLAGLEVLSDFYGKARAQMGVRDWPEDVILVELPQKLAKHEVLQSVIDVVRSRCGCDVVVDFSNVDVVGSPTFSRLLELRSLLRRSGHKLVLCGVAPATKGVFAVSQLDRLFDFVDDKSAALRTLRVRA